MSGLTRAPALIRAATERYEAARAWATGAPTGAGCPPGLALLMRRGLPVWLAAWETEPWLCALDDASGSPSTPGASPARPGVGGDDALARVLATMVEQCRQGRQGREGQG